MSTRTGGRGIVPGLGIGEERLVDRVGREVITVFDDDDVVGLCDGLPVRCDFDHFQVLLAALCVGGWWGKDRGVCDRRNILLIL